MRGSFWTCFQFYFLACPDTSYSSHFNVYTGVWAVWHLNCQLQINKSCYLFFKSRLCLPARRSNILSLKARAWTEVNGDNKGAIIILHPPGTLGYIITKQLTVNKSPAKRLQYYTKCIISPKSLEVSPSRACHSDCTQNIYSVIVQS